MDQIISELGPLKAKLRSGALGIALAGLLAAGAQAALVPHGGRRFMLAYLAAFAFVLSLSLGGLFFVFIQHLTRAGWSVMIRRLAEALAANVVVVAILFLPIAGFVLLNNGELYPWAQPDSNVVTEHHHTETAKAAETSHAVAAEGKAEAEHAEKPAKTEASKGEHAVEVTALEFPESHNIAEEHNEEDYAHQKLDELTLKKRGWLNVPFFLVRWVIYLGLWGGIATWYWRKSVEQDRTGDIQLTLSMERFAAPVALIYGLSLTYASIDLIMSLNPHWFSTIFGVYYFAGCVVSTLALLIVLVLTLQSAGVLTDKIGIEHKHDLGKLMFGFVFFWGYIAFSQYMLLWYSSIPEEIVWLKVRGMTTATGEINQWSIVALIMLFGNFLIPFPGLLSRHVKRNPATLIFWAFWLLVMHAIDMWWMVMPEFGSKVTIGLVEVGLMISLIGFFAAGFFHRLGSASLVPVQDPRLSESVSFENI